jgi:integrase
VPLTGRGGSTPLSRIRSSCKRAPSWKATGIALLGPTVKKALKAAGVRQVRFHDLRHTFGTRIAAAGVPMRVLQAWMGHRDYRTTLIYADYEPGDEESGLVDAAFSRA